MARAFPRGAVAGNPVHRDESFPCDHCGLEVPRGGARVRDHCPRCLRSRHLDRVPGDRASTCGGLMHPRGLEVKGADYVLTLVCAGCGHRFRVRSHPTDLPAALRRLSAGEEPWQ